MKKQLSWLCCGMLAASALTGCVRTDVYETEHFSFSVSSDWRLEQAEYNENTKKNDYLRFEFSNRDGCYIQEHQTDLSVSDLAAQFGETEPREELSGCKYPAWRSVQVLSEQKKDDVTIGATVYIDAGDTILRIAANHPHGADQPFDLPLFDDALQVLLGTLTLKTDGNTGNSAAQPTEMPGEADTSALHVTWSADWEKKIILRDHPEQELWLVLSSPDYKTDETTSFIVRDEGDTASAQESIDNLLAADGSESEYATNTVVRMDDKTLCGITFGDALRMVHTFKSDGSETVYRYYYLTVGDRVYSVMLMCDSKGKDNMNELLRGITLTAK